MNYFNCVPYSTDWFGRSSAEVGHELFLGGVNVLFLQIFYLYIFIYLCIKPFVGRKHGGIRLGGGRKKARA